jgi:Trk K+ transport system NAD-binding subunit
MRSKFLLIAGLAGLLMLSGVIVFHFGHDLGWLDSWYFVVTVMTTVGFGDISLKDATPGVKLFGIFLMLASCGMVAVTLGFITDYLLKTRLEQVFGPRRLRMRNHIVLCGLGHVGIRILEQLHKLGEQVVVVEKSEDCRFLDEVRQMNIPVITADVRLPSVLERVNIKEARSIIAATDDDLVNLAVALHARQVRPDIRVVLRMFDHDLANRIRSGFGIKTTFSTSGLAAPAFAMAAVDPAVVGSLYVGQDLVLVLQLAVARGSKLEGITLEQLRKQGSLSVLCHQAAGERHLHPADSVTLAAGDEITVSASSEVCRHIKEMNVS